MLAARMLSQLIEHSNRKSYLPIVCYEAISELLKKTSAQVYQHHFVPILQPIIYQPEIESYTPEALFIVLVVFRLFPADSQLQTKLSDFDTNDGFASLLRKMRNPFTDSTHSHPMVHLLWTPLLADLVSKQSDNDDNNKFEERLRHFWSIVVDETLLSGRKYLELYYLAFMLFSKLLPQLKPRFIPLVFSKNFVNQLKVALLRKQHSLIYPAAKYAAEAMLQTAANNPDARKFISTSICSERKLLRIPLLKTFAETKSSLEEICSHVDAMMNLFQRAVITYNSEKTQKQEAIRQIKHFTWILDQLDHQTAALFRLCLSPKNVPHIEKIRDVLFSILRFFQSIAFYCFSPSSMDGAAISTTTTTTTGGGGPAKLSETVTIVLNDQPTEVTVYVDKAIPTEIRDSCSIRFTNMLRALCTKRTTALAQKDQKSEDNMEEADVPVNVELSHAERADEWLQRSVSFAVSIENISSGNTSKQNAKRKKQTAQPTSFHSNVEFYGPMKDSEEEQVSARKRMLNLAANIEQKMTSAANIEATTKRRFMDFLNLVRVVHLFMPIQPNPCIEWLDDMEGIFKDLFIAHLCPPPPPPPSKTPTKQGRKFNKTRATTHVDAAADEKPSTSTEKPLFVLADLCIATLSASPHFFSRFTRPIFSSFADAFLEIDSRESESVIGLLLNALKSTNEDSGDATDSDEDMGADSSDAESDHKEEEEEEEENGDDGERKGKFQKKRGQARHPSKKHDRSEHSAKDDTEDEDADDKSADEEDEDEEEEEEELLGDDEMLKMNHALSMLFHQKRLELLRRQEARRNVRQFKSEIFHLLTILTDAASTTTPLLSMLVPLIEYMQTLLGVSTQQVLNSHLEQIVHKICTRPITADGAELSDAAEEAIRRDISSLIQNILSRKANKLHPSFFEATTFLTNVLLTRASRLTENCDYLLGVHRDIFNQDHSNDLQRKYSTRIDAPYLITKLLTSFAKTVFERDAAMGYKFISSTVLAAVGDTEARMSSRIYALCVLTDICVGPLSIASFFADSNQLRSVLSKFAELLSSLLKGLIARETDNEKRTAKTLRAFGHNLHIIVTTVRKLLGKCRSNQIQLLNMSTIHAVLDEIIALPNQDAKTIRLCKEFKGETR